MGTIRAQPVPELVSVWMLLSVSHGEEKIPNYNGAVRSTESFSRLSATVHPNPEINSRDPDRAASGI